MFQKLITKYEPSKKIGDEKIDKEQNSDGTAYMNYKDICQRLGVNWRDEYGKIGRHLGHYIPYVYKVIDFDGEKNSIPLDETDLTISFDPNGPDIQTYDLRNKSRTADQDGYFESIRMLITLTKNGIAKIEAYTSKEKKNETIRMF